MFFANQFPYLEVRRPFILGTQQRQWRATIGHRFIELLHKHGKLTRLYTQNIDGLDYQCEGLPAEKIIPVHGTIGRVSCEKCGAEQDHAAFCDKAPPLQPHTFPPLPSTRRRQLACFCRHGSPPRPAPVCTTGAEPDQGHLQRRRRRAVSVDTDRVRGLRQRDCQALDGAVRLEPAARVLQLRRGGYARLRPPARRREPPIPNPGHSALGEIVLGRAHRWWSPPPTPSPRCACPPPAALSSTASPSAWTSGCVSATGGTALWVGIVTRRFWS